MTNRIERFEDLIAWQKARTLVTCVYRLCNFTAFHDDRALLNQIRRSAVSVVSNIAEGFERGGRREFHQFLSVAKGSCAELRTQIYVARDVGFLTEESAGDLLRRAEEVGRILGGLRRAVAKQRLSPQSSVLSPRQAKASR